MNWDTTVTQNRNANWWHIKAVCSECGRVIYLALPKREFPTRTDTEHAALELNMLRDHADQHEPGRALDISVDWELVASCSVCEDGGHVIHTGEELMCERCCTTWSVDGTMGEINE